MAQRAIILTIDEAEQVIEAARGHGAAAFHLSILGPDDLVHVDFMSSSGEGDPRIASGVIDEHGKLQPA